MSDQNVLLVAAAVAVVAAIAVVYIFMNRGKDVKRPSKKADGRKPKRASESKPQAKAASSRPEKPAARAEGKAARRAAAPVLEDLSESEQPEITLVTVRLDALVQEAAGKVEGTRKGNSDLPSLADVEVDVDLEPSALARPLVADDGADVDVPTLSRKAFLVSASRQTDPGLRRERNEDRYLAMDEAGVFVVADGMGGYAGGAIAAEIAVNTIETAFKKSSFDARVEARLPRRALEFVKAFQMANLAIWERATSEPHLQGMGTTLVGCRFTLGKRRVYIGHVGDSRCYRLRDKALKQLTSDHTLGSLGVQGPSAAHLVRAVGIGTEVEVDVIMAEPKIGDVYLLCSDGLTKMVQDAEIEQILIASADLDAAVQTLVDRANERGGRDNTTVVLVAVLPADSGTEDGSEVA